MIFSLPTVTSRASCVFFFFLKGLAARHGKKKKRKRVCYHNARNCVLLHLIKQVLQNAASFRSSLEKCRIVCEGILAARRNEMDLIKKQSGNRLRVRLRDVVKKAKWLHCIYMFRLESAHAHCKREWNKCRDSFLFVRYYSLVNVCMLSYFGERIEKPLHHHFK